MKELYPNVPNWRDKETQAREWRGGRLKMEEDKEINI
jgi:hypothetical protein